MDNLTPLDNLTFATHIAKREKIAAFRAPSSKIFQIRLWLYIFKMIFTFFESNPANKNEYQRKMYRFLTDLGSENVSEELDPETFRDCKEKLRPVKKALKQLDRPPATSDGNQEQVKNDHVRRCLLQIGDRVAECLQEFGERERIKDLKRNLWIFVSKFTEFNPEKLQKFYKIAVKRREFERKMKMTEVSESLSAAMYSALTGAMV